MPIEIDMDEGYMFIDREHEPVFDTVVTRTQEIYNFDGEAVTIWLGSPSEDVSPILRMF